MPEFFHRLIIGCRLLLLLSATGIGDTPLTAAPQSQQQLEEASRLNNEVVRLFPQGKFAEAIPFAKKALAIWETELGPNDTETALGLTNLAELYRAQADFNAAKPLHARALRIRERALGSDHLDTALSATYVAIVEESLGDYPAAEKHYQQALTIRENALGEDHPEVASALNNMANLLRNQSKYAEAEALFLRGLAIRRRTQGPDHLDSAPSLDNLASIYRAQGRFAEAEPLYLQALKIREKELGPENHVTAITLNNLASLYDDQSRYDEAEPLFRRALQIRARILGNDHPETAITANNLGGLSERQGNFAAAEQLYRQALATLEKTSGPEHYDTGIVLNNLASLYKRQERYDDAEPLYERALQISEMQLGPEHRHTAQILSNLGGLRELQGDFTNAESHYRRSLEIREKVLGTDHPDTAQSVNNLALLVAAQGNTADAITLLQQSLEIRQRTLGDDHPTTVGGLENLATYLEKQNNPESIDTFDRARRGVRTHVIKVLPALPEREQSLFLKVNYERGFQQALSCALIHAKQPDVVEKSAAWLLNGKAVGREALAQRNLKSRPDSSEQAAVKWVELEQLRQALPSDSVFIDIARFKRFDFEIRPGESTWLPAHYAAWITPAVGQGEIQLIDLGPADSIDELVTKVREQLVRAPGEKGEIATTSEQESVTRLNQTLQTLADRIWTPLAPYLADSKELVLSPDGDLWLLPWATLPVEKNKDGESTWLIEKFSLRLAVSGRDLTPVDAATSSAPPVILANPEFDQRAGEKEQSVKGIFRKLPPTDEETVRGFSAKFTLPEFLPLPNTEVEAIAIQPQIEIYAGQSVTLYKQRYALESVAKALRGPKVAVFATHGFFLPQQQTDAQLNQDVSSDNSRSALLDADGKPYENPLLRCGLLLAGCNQRGAAVGHDDGILTGVEVTGIDFRGTELVVLSACETGIGDINQGEGVAGLRQAFQLAGAKAVVASLWQISDRETALLINEFFHSLADGRSKAEALRNAQLSRIEKRRERYGAAHPFYWAAFTLTGI